MCFVATSCTVVLCLLFAATGRIALGVIPQGSSCGSFYFRENVFLGVSYDERMRAGIFCQVKHTVAAHWP